LQIEQRDCRFCRLPDADDLFRPNSFSRLLASGVLHDAGMNPKTLELKQRTKRFALDVLAFVRSLPMMDDAKDIGRQLMRSATSVGANYRAVCRGRSRAEFVSPLGIALEEADESAFWLEILIESEIAPTPKARGLLEEANQLTAIFAQSSLTASENRARTR
jgi:four helix bundle protein